MFDAHLHLPLPATQPTTWGALVASSTLREWPQMAQANLGKRNRKMLGFLPQNWSREYSIDLLSNMLVSYLESDPCLAVGEIGLDKRYHCRLDLTEQIRLCTTLLGIANEYQRPVALHVVGSDGAMLELLKRERPQIPLLWHGFSGSLESAREATHLGCTLSLGLTIWRGGNKLQVALPHLPTPYLLETDYPYHYREPGFEDLTYHELLTRHYQLFAQAIGTEQETLEHYCDTQSKIFTN